MHQLIKVTTFVLSFALLLANGKAKALDSKVSTELLGDVSYSQVVETYPFFNSAHSTDNNTDNKTTTPSPQSIEQLKAISEATQLTVFFGLWCHDSVREVPQLMNLLDKVNNPNISHQLIALDHAKQEPQGRAKANNILYTPTILVSQGNKELGRITEQPDIDLATDLAQILSTESD